MKSLNLLSFDELQDLLKYRHLREEYEVTREEILEELNSRVAMIRCPYIQKHNGDGSVAATRSYFK